MLKRFGLGAVSLGIVVATFAFVLPTIADYREVWALVQDLSWEWIAALFATTLVNLLTFAPPWMVALPGLSFPQAITVTQVSTALSIVPYAVMTMTSVIACDSLTARRTPIPSKPPMRRSVKTMS